MAEALTAAPRFEMRGVGKRSARRSRSTASTWPCARGEVCALVGQNGAGKSTLMAILAGAAPPDAGEMPLDGAPYAPRNPLEARRAGVAMIYQELSLAPHLSVMENIVLGVEPTRFGIVRSRRDARRGAARAGASSATPTSDPDAVGRRPVAGGAAARRDRAGPRHRLPRARARRADEQPRARRRRAAVRPDRAPEGRGHAIVYISHFIEEVTAGRRIASSCCATAGTRATAPPRRRRASDIVAELMVGRALDDILPAQRAIRRRADPGARRRRCRARRRSRCIAARSSALPGCSAPGGRGCCATHLRARARSQRTGARGRTSAGPRSPDDAMASGHGPAERGSDRRRSRARPLALPTT